MDSGERVEKRRQSLERQRVRTVAERVRRIVVDFHEYAVHAAGDSGSRKILDEL